MIQNKISVKCWIRNCIKWMRTHNTVGTGGKGDLSEKVDVDCLEGGESQDQSDHPQDRRAEGPEIA